MNRQCIPLTTATADMPSRISEIRLPMRSNGHNLRNSREVEA